MDWQIQLRTSLHHLLKQRLLPIALNTLTVGALLLASSALSAYKNNTLIIPADTDYSALTSSYIYNANFSTDPTQEGQVAAAVDRRDNNVHLFLVNNTLCLEAGQSLTYRIVVRNVGDQAITSMIVEAEFGGNAEHINSVPPGQVEGSTVIWQQAQGLVPGAYTDFVATMRFPDGGFVINSAKVEYTLERGGQGQVVTTHEINRNCERPNPPTFPLPDDKFPAIFCDPAEIGCTQLIPRLGVRFGQAQDPQNQVRVCSPNDPRGCTPHKPTLGVRFREAVGDFEPGECRVLEDDVLITPEYHDALDRDGESASLYLMPLYESAQDFKKLAHENNLLGIRLQNQALQELRELHDKYWNEHLNIVDAVLSGSMDPGTALDELNTLLQEWDQEIQVLQQGFSEQYQRIQDTRRDRFEPLEQQAINRAETVLEQTCGILNERVMNQFENSLADTQAEYNRTLQLRINAFTTMQTNYRQLITVRNLWRGQLFPAITAFGGGNREPLQSYRSSTGDTREQTFRDDFELYVNHTEGDMTNDERVRLQFWDVSLDIPKSAATACYTQNTLNAPVEVTYCESDGYPQQVVREAPVPEKAQDGRQVALPDTSGLNTNTTIDPGNVAGAACGGRPGDPYWAPSCQCKCGDIVNCPGIGPTFCQICYPITRHDIFVTTQEECLLDGPKHSDPFF